LTRLPGWERTLACVRAALDHKAYDLVVLETGRVSSIADYFVVCSGRSDTQVEAIADGIDEDLRRNGERPLTVTAVTQTIKPDIYPKVDDEATIVLTYPKAQAILQASWNWPFDRKDMEVYGQAGYVKTIKRDELEVRLPGEVQGKRVEPTAIAPPEDDSLNYLRAVVRNGLKPEGLGSLEVNVVVAEILDAARESAKSGKTVKMK